MKTHSSCQGQQQAGAALRAGHHGRPTRADCAEQIEDVGAPMDWGEWLEGYLDWMEHETGRVVPKA